VGLRIVGAAADQPVPPVPPGATRAASAVTWRIGADEDGRYDLLVHSSQGTAQKQSVVIRTRGVFD
jgi:hypothetical protein